MNSKQDRPANNDPRDIKPLQSDNVAVILPIYNPGEEIVMTLDSLRKQTIPFKLFVTDDGSSSKPDYHKLLHGFDYELIELKQNVGVCVVRNASIKIALDQEFEFLAMMDCGDMAYPERLQKQRDFMIKNPDIGLLGTAIEIFEDDVNYLHDYCPPTEPAALQQSLFYGAAFVHPTMIYRAELLRKIGLYIGDYDVAEDYEIARRAARVSDVANLPDILLKKIEDISSVSTKRRMTGLISRLRVQWHYRDLTKLHCWLGMIKSLVVIVTPTSWVKWAHSHIYGKRTSLQRTNRQDA